MCHIHGYWSQEQLCNIPAFSADAQINVSILFLQCPPDTVTLALLQVLQLTVGSFPPYSAP